MRYQENNNEGEVMSSMFVQTASDYGISFDPSEGKTRQEFADECDINKLMERYEKSGVISHMNQTPAQYLDLGDASHLDLQYALEVLNGAEAAFNALPAKVRAEFQNDAMSFVAFAENAENIGKLREWGLAKPEATEPPPTKVEIVSGKAPTDAVQAAVVDAGTK